jgi:hippurate hydrolase
VAKLVNRPVPEAGLFADPRHRLAEGVDVQGAASWAIDLVLQVLGEAQALEMPTPVMGAEDFSEVLDEVPGAMVLLGTCPEGQDFFSAAPCHSNRMVANKTAMAADIAMFAAVVLSEAPVT